MLRMMQRLALAIVGFGLITLSSSVTQAQTGAASEGSGSPATSTEKKPAAEPAKSAKSAEAPSSKSSDSATKAPAKARDSVYVDFAPAEAPSATTAKAAAAERGGSASPEEKKMSFLFRYAPWEKVLQRFAQEAQLTLDMGEGPPPGTFNYYDNGLYTPVEALDILNGYLLPKGYVLVRRDRFLVVSPTNAIAPSLIPQVSLSDLTKRGRNEIVSVVLPLNESMDAKTAMDDVKELLNAWGKVVPLTKANRLLVTDTASNLLTIHELLTGMGGVAEPKANAFRSFKLKYVSANDAERMIRELFGLPPRGTITSTNVTQPAATTNVNPGWGGGGRWGGGGGRWGGGGGRWGGGGGDWQGGRDVSSMATTTTTTTNGAAATTTAARLQMTVDTRTNSLLVTATGEDLTLVENAIKTIDVPEGPGVAARMRRSNTPQLEVYALETAEPHVVVEVLKTTVPGLVIHEDVKSRRLNVYATPAEHEIVRNVVKQVDSGAGETVAVLQLQKLDPLAAASSFRAMFNANGRTADAPSIEADSAGRRLLVRGTTEQITQIRKMLKELDGDGEGVESTQNGPYRMLSPGGRSADEIVNLIQKMLVNDHRTTIRVVSPSTITTPQFKTRELEEDAAKPESRTAPSVKPAAPEAKPDVKKEPVSNTVPGPAREARKVAPAGKASAVRLVRVGNQLAVVDADGARPEKEGAAKSDKSTKSSEVRISTYGGNIMLYSDDQAALNRVEKLIDSVVRAAPPKTTWTVYHLRVADATEVSLMLGQLFPQGSIGQPEGSSGLGNFSALGGSLLNMARGASLSSSQQLRIVPETRNNSLFISGSEDQVNQVLEALKILDATERPESLKDRVAHMVSVEYADVDEVAEIVRDVYKDQMDGGQAAGGAANVRAQNTRGNGGNFNPIAMLMGGAGAAQQARPRDAQLSIGVDRRTNTLVVAANEQMFRQVESLVKALDESAREANRTIRVVNLQNGNPAAMQQALGAMLTKVKVNGAKTASGAANATPAQGAGASPWAGGQTNDDVRNFWRQRMMNGGGAGGGNWGGGNWGQGQGGRWGGGNGGGGNRGGGGRRGGGNN